MGEVLRKDIPVVATEFQIANKSGVTRTKRNGTVVREVAVATFNPSAVTGDRTAAAHALGVYIPSGAIITKVWYDVVTTFASTAGGTDLATIALHVQSAGDIVVAIAISDASNVWDAGMHASIIGFPNFGADAAHDSALEVAALFAATYLKTTAVREITATVATAALTAGKLNVYVEYTLSD
jgi:hypothetical protein